MATKARRLRRPGPERDQRPTLERELASVIDRQPSVERVGQGRDLWQSVQNRLTDEERRLAELRGLGHTWVGVSAEMGGSAESRRKQMTRALDRVLQELGIDEAQ